MLKKLRREFCAITLLLVGCVLVAVLGSTLASTVSTQQQITREMLEKSLQLGRAQAPTMGMGENADRAFVVTLDVSDAGVVLSRSGAAIEIDSDQVADVIADAIESSEGSGQDLALHVAWMKRESASGFTVALCDTTSRDAAIAHQVMVDTVVFVLAMAILFLVVRALSKWVLAPVEEAWDQQRRFISDASHELKTPLAVIVANTQILQKDEGIPEGSRRWVRSTADEAAHMKGLVEDLLTLARADEARAGTSENAIRRQDVCLSDVVDEAALEFDAVAFERGCAIEGSIDPNVHVKGDPDQLGRIARTLLDNATKYAAEKSVVRVALTQEHDHAHLTVNNLGPTIAEDDLSHLFDRFYRTDKARERQSSGGYGLGLAIAKSTVEAHGGKIWATSAANEGTTFHVIL